MAITVYTSSDERWAFAEQVTWGTAKGDGSNSIGILTEGFGINSNINFWNPPRARKQRYNTLADEQADQKGVVYQIDGMSIPVTTDTIDYILYCIFQNVTETSVGGGVYAKSFTFPQTQPDFTVNAGKFINLWNKAPSLADRAKMYDAICSELVLSCSSENNEGILWAAPTFVSRYHSDIKAYNGTITYPTLNTTTQKNVYDMTAITIESSGIVLGDAGFTLTIRNNAKKFGVDTTNNVFLGFILPRYEVELTMSVLWDSISRTRLTQAKAGTADTVSITWLSSATNNGYFNITLEAKLQNIPELEHAIEGNFVNLNYIGGGTFGGTVPLTIGVSNTTDRSW